IVKRGEEVTADVTVSVTGEAAPGTLVTQDATTVTVSAEALNIPESLEVSVAGAEAGTQVTAAEISLPKGVSLVTDAETLIANVTEARVIAEAEPETEAAEGEAAEGESAE
ncbi:50S ribosomal protein L25/general stress protein Ctc, partial [Nocardia sp. NPDC003345]